MRTGVAIAVAAAALAVLPSAAQADACSATDGASLTSKLADPTCDFISLAAGSYTSASGFTAPARTVEVAGPGASTANITRTGAGDVFTVPTGATLSLGGVSLGGASNGAGLAVTGTGAATLSNAVVSGNTSSSSGAGIAFSGATLNVSNITISGNLTTANGGGFENSGVGTANFHEVLFTQNTATGSGGGGAADTSGLGSMTNLKNAVFTANHASADGGAVRAGATGAANTNLNNVTIAGNVADNDNSGGGDGGGISNSGGIVSIGNSIVANNTALGGGAPDCDSAVASPLTRTGYELIRNATGCTFGGADTTTGYLTGVDPLLGVLGFHGGTLPSMPLLPGSPAVNAGSPATPTGSGGTCETVDERSRVRTAAAVLPCDLGAFEVQPAVCHSIFMTIGIGAVTAISLDCSGDPFLYSIATAPTHGSLSGFDPVTGHVTYAPAAGFAGTDSFTFKAVNGPLSSGSSSVTFSVKGPTSPTPNAPAPAGKGFDLKAAIKRCKTRVPKGPKRAKCIKKARKRAKNT
jgi:fibronectin-binding autotransporter adhesin